MSEEKKIDDSDVMHLLDVASPEEKGFKSNVNNILFGDESPPSPPNLSFKTSPSALATRILQENSRSESPSSEGGEVDPSSDQLKLPGTPPMKPTRTVKFNMNDSPGSSYNLDEASEESLLDRLTKTQDRLTQAQIALSGEKALRKRKDKNLVKLAKELQKRAAVLNTKDQQIAKMTTMVNVVTDKEKEASEAARAAEEKYRSTTVDFEARISSLSAKHAAEAATLEQKYRSACTLHETQLEGSAREQHAAYTRSQQQQAQAKLEFDSQMSSLESQYETMLSQLRLEILQTNLEADQLRSKVQALECGEGSFDDISVSPRSASSTEKPKRRRRRLSNYIAWFLVLVLTVLMAAPVAFVMAIRFDVLHQATFLNEYLPMEHLNMDSLCAPTPIGTKRLDGKFAQIEAPWWVVPELKHVAFGAACEDRPRIRLSLQDGKLSAFKVEKDREEVLWKESAHSAVVENDEIILYNRRGKEVKRLDTPWAVRSLESTTMTRE